MDQPESRRKMTDEAQALLRSVESMEAGKDDDRRENLLDRVRAAQKDLAEARDDDTWAKVSQTVRQALDEVRKGLAAYE